MRRLLWLTLTVLLVSIPNASGQGTNLPICNLDGDGISVTELQIDGTAKPTIVQMGTSGSVILMLTTAGTLYRSADSGLTYQKWPGFPDKVNVISPTADPQQAFLYSAYSSEYMQFTEDAGQTWNRRQAPGRVNWCDWHPAMPDSLLCLVVVQCRTGIYCTAAAATMNFGRSWVTIANYVYMAMWAFSTSPTVMNPPDALFLTHNPKETPNPSWDDYNLYGCSVSAPANCSANPIIVGAFLLLENDDPSHQSTYTATLNPLRLYVSNNRSFTWQAAVMPKEFANPLGTTYVFAGKSGVFLGASAAYRGGTSYVDFYAGDSWFEDFSLSIPYVVRSAHVEWQEVSSLNGVYIANAYDIEAGYPTVSSPIVTKITYDYGGAWHFLQPPAGSVCSEPKECHLHLASWSEMPASPVLSPHDVIGYVIANGNVGATLGNSANMSTFLSTDGGWTWSMFYPGQSVFEFGDHGGFIVLVPYGSDTNNLIYTWDGGITREQCGFSLQAMSVYDIIPSDYSDGYFWIYGWRYLNTTVKVPVIVTVSFNEFHERVCTAADYEVFVPSGFNNSCELGVHIGYSRRKVDADCANPSDWLSVSSPVGAPCPCSMEDYECDWCYEYDAALNACTFVCDPSQQGLPPPDCKNVWYPYAGGWRLVAGTMCDMNAPTALRLLGAAQACPPPSATSALSASASTTAASSTSAAVVSSTLTTAVSSAVQSALATATSSTSASITTTTTSTVVTSASTTKHPSTTAAPHTSAPEHSSGAGTIILILFVVLLIIVVAICVTLYHHNDNFRDKIQELLTKIQSMTSSSQRDPFTLPESALDRKGDGANVPLVSNNENDDV